MDHELALKRFKKAQDEESDNRDAFADDIEFYNGEQWPSGIKKDRDADRRPCLTINKQPAFVKQVTNEQRKNKPAIKVLPFDSGADPDTAKILTGLIRHIRNNSKAKIAYNTANKDQVIRGKGYFRIETDYTNEWSRDQEIYIRRIRNPNTVYFDPNCQEFDYSDAEWAFITYDYDKEEYEELWPDKSVSQFPADLSDTQKPWLSDKIRVAEYFWIDKKKETLLYLANGLNVLERQYEELLEGIPEEQTDQLAIVGERETEIRTVKHCLINGIEPLEEEKDTVFRWIPIVPVVGEENDVNGKVTYKGMVRDNKDPQRQYNFWRTAQTELIALAPKAPYLGAKGAFKGQEKRYEAANNQNIPYLEYEMVVKNGVPAPPPQRQPFAGIPAGAIQAHVDADKDMRAVNGFRDEGMGMATRQRSEGAILALQAEGDTATFDYIDNLSIALEQAGRIIVDAIPKVYDTERMVRILGEDGSEEMVKLTKGMSNPDKKLFNLNTGNYDVVVSTGPAYATRRQESANKLTELIGKYPQMGTPIMDLLVKAMDMPDGDAVAERWEAIIEQQYPGLINKDGEKPTPAQFNALKMQLEKAMQEVQMLGQEVQSKEKDRQTKLIENKNDNDTKLAVAQLEYMGKADLEELKQNNKLIETQLKAGVDLEQTNIRAQTDIITKGMTAKVDIE